MARPSIAPVRASLFCWWSSDHCLNPLVLLFMEMFMFVSPPAKDYSRLSIRGGTLLTAFAVAFRASSASLSESLIGGECHNHQDDKNGNDERWNKPGCHGS